MGLRLARLNAGFSAAPAPIAPPAASASSNISSADPQVTSSGLLSSGMGNSFSHRNDLKAPEPAVLSHQVCFTSADGVTVVVSCRYLKLELCRCI